MGGKENGERGGDHRKESGDTPWEAAGESSSSSFSWTSLGISQQPPVPSGEEDADSQPLPALPPS